MYLAVGMAPDPDPDPGGALYLAVGMLDPTDWLSTNDSLVPL